MNLLTNWGYTVIGAESLPNVLTEQDFATFTAGKYTGDSRIAPSLASVSDAIRNFCGWHVYPSENCEMSTTMLDKRVTRVNGDLQIQLPSRYVTSVTSVTLGGTQYTAFSIDTNGILMIYDVDFSALRRYSAVVVKYVAGLPDGLMGAIKEIAAHRVTHALANSYGVQSESAGGVSITYSANWSNAARATALADDNKEVLEPFRVQGVF